MDVAGDHIDEGGLARAVGPDDADSLLGRHVERDRAGGYDRAKGFFELAHREDGAHGVCGLRDLKRETTEPNPSGKNNMVSKRTEPRISCQVPGNMSTAIERINSNANDPTKVAATELVPAKIVTNTNPPDVVQ